MLLYYIKVNFYNFLLLRFSQTARLFIFFFSSSYLIQTKFVIVIFCCLRCCLWICICIIYLFPFNNHVVVQFSLFFIRFYFFFYFEENVVYRRVLCIYNKCIYICLQRFYLYITVCYIIIYMRIQINVRTYKYVL